IGAVALLIQYRALSISEKELRTKVVEISSVVDELKRVKDENKETNLKMILEDTKLLKSSNEMNKVLLDTNKYDGIINRSYAANFALSLSALGLINESKIFMDEETRNNIVGGIVGANLMLIKLIHISQEWHEKLEKIGNHNYDIAVLSHEQDKINEQYSKRYKEIANIRNNIFSNLDKELSNILTKKTAP
ncbi:MAG: hypothetical protein KAT52_08795, partial [Desulfobacterales bacterium]|nr:hypothetical protein [Desulfobacterales bacterium]